MTELDRTRIASRFASMLTGIKNSILGRGEWIAGVGQVWRRWPDGWPIS